MSERETIEKILGMKRIAVVGLSSNPERPSFMVASYLKGKGHEVIPVNPKISEWEGKRSYPDLESIPKGADVVCIFRKPEEVQPVVASAIKIGAKAVWMQEGITDARSAEAAQKAGILVVMDRCMKKESEWLERKGTLAS